MIEEMINAPLNTVAASAHWMTEPWAPRIRSCNERLNAAVAALIGRNATSQGRARMLAQRRGGTSVVAPSTSFRRPRHQLKRWHPTEGMYTPVTNTYKSRHVSRPSEVARSVAVGFVLISTAPAKEHEVYTELLRVKEIVELHPLFGEYDLIAKVEAADFNALGQVVVDKIRSVAGVIDTKTLTGIKF